MKKLIRIILIAISVSTCCFFNNALGLEADKPSFGEVSSSIKSVSKTILDDGMSKKETVSVLNYNFINSLKDNLYKYIVVSVALTYCNESNDKILVMANIESSFRYNTETREAECLSISKGHISNDTNYSLSIFSRKVNISTEKGGNISEIKFKHKGKTYDESICKISCDYIGNVTIE